MKAIERNERLYNILVLFTENDITPNDVSSYTPEHLEVVKILSDSEYIEVITKRKGQTAYGEILSLKYVVTIKGWQFMEYYENHKANQKLMSIQLEDYEYQRKVTRISIRVAIASALTAALSFTYTLYDAHTNSIKNDILMKENYTLRDSLTLYNAIKYGKDTAQSKGHSGKEK